jgi:hypothetical protein
MYLQKQVPYYETGQTPQYGKIRDPYLDEGNFVFEVENRSKSNPRIMTLYYSMTLYSSRLGSNPANWKTSRNSKGDSVYKGEVSNGLPNGQGTYTSSDGYKYVGEFKDGLRNGQGTSTSPNGYKYVGEFKDGFPNGQGTLTLPVGRRTLTFPSGNGGVLHGLWKDGEFLGEKTLHENKSESKTVTLYISEDDYWTNSSSWKTSRNLESDYVYVGEISNGIPNGQGTFTYLDGRKYVGAFKDGKYDGQGTFTSPDGAKYVGAWKDNKKHGLGTFIWPDGRVWGGLWKDGGFLGTK